MAKFFSRLFRSNSSSKSSSFRSSQTSFNDNQSRSKTSSTARTTTSLENLASYHIIPKELEKNKLHKASWEGNLHKVERLARPGQINIKDQQMRTPLHLAVVKGHIDIVKYLVDENAKLDVVDSEQRTPLIKAVLSGNQNPKLNYQICQVLLDGGAGAYINAVDKHGKNALHYAIDFDNENLVNLFLLNENCDPNFKDRDQMTPLHLAIKRKNPRIIQLLLSDQRDQQADPNIVNRYGQTPLHIAASVGYIDIVQHLLGSNLDEPCDPTIVDSQQLTPYESAKANHQEACAKLIKEYEEKWLKKPLRRPTSLSINDQPSIKATSSISMNPATNLQRIHDETSDDSSSVSTSKPSKSSPRRIKRPSDQWSDDNVPSISESKPASHNLANLFKNNPLQPNERNSVLNNLVNNNPLQKDLKKQTSTGKSITSQKTQPSSIFGIGPATERKDSDNTSTSMSIDKPAVISVQSNSQNKSIKSSNPYVNTKIQPVSNTKSWSDDTITSPIPKPLQTKNQQQQPQSDTWDTSPTDDDSSVSKPKNSLSNLQKTQPFAPSTSHLTNSDSDDNSVETEIRKLDFKKPTNETVIQNLVNKNIGNGYKVIGTSEIQSPINDDSSWTTSSLQINKESTTKGIHNLVQKQKTDESTWDDSRPLSADLKKPNLSHQQPTGIENLTKIIETIMHLKRTQQKPASPKIIGKLLVSPMAERPNSQNTLYELENDEDFEKSWKKKPTEEWSISSTNGQDFKNLRQLPRSSLPYDVNSVRGSISSSKSSFNDIQLNELKENIKKLERNQEDTQELKRQLKDMEKKKNNFEKLYKENDQMLRDIESKLEHEKNEKQRLERTTKNLNIELQNIKQNLQSLENEKDLLNQRCIKLKEERDNHDEKLHVLHANNIQSVMKTGSFSDEDIDKMKSRHREEMKLLSAENDDLHHRTKQLQSDLQLHKESLDVTVRYKIDLEKALEEKTLFQHELDHLKYEKDLIEKEKVEYKTKYDSLQEEIRNILLDRSKLEQKLTGELHEHIQEKQRSTDDIRKCQTQIEDLNIKLGDAEARLLVLQTQNVSLLTSKDRDIKSEFESLTQRLNKIELDKLDAEQRYHNQHTEITNKQQRISNEPLIHHTSTTLNNGIQHQHSFSSSCTKCGIIQKNYEQEHQYNLQTQKDNEYLRDFVLHHRSTHHLNKTFPQENNENYLIENSRQIRSDTERVKTELDRLRQDFDRLISNYEPSYNYNQKIQLHSQIDTFRQFYEQEFQQRQLFMSKLNRKIQSSSNINHNHSFNGTSSCTTCTNNRVFKERLETAIDTTLADQRLQTIKRISTIPRQVSSLLTINNNNNTLSIDPLRKRYHV